MREGLRSSRSWLEVEIDKPSVSQVLVKEESLQNNLDCNGSGEEALCLESEKQKVVPVDTNHEQVAVATVCTVVKGKVIEDTVEENKVGETRLNLIDSKLGISGRVLRSRVTVTSGDNCEDARVESGSVVAGKRRIEGCEKDSFMTEVHESDWSNKKEYNMAKCKRGRPPKVQDTTATPMMKLDDEVEGAQKESRMAMKEDETGKLAETLNMFKRNRGRPPKVQDTLATPKMELDEEVLGAHKSKRTEFKEDEAGKLVGTLKKKFKRKRGRPPKVKDTIATPKLELDDEVLKAYNESKRAEMKEDETSKLVGTLKNTFKRKRGRPPKVQDTIATSKMELDEEVLGSQESKRAEMKDGETGKLVGTLKKFKRKRGRPPKVQDTIVTPKIELDLEVLGVQKETKRAGMKEDKTGKLVGTLKKKFKLKRGRPPKVQESYGNVDMDTIMEDMLEGKNKNRRIKMEEEKNVGLVGKLKRRPGRPPKLSESNGSLKVDTEDKVARSKKSLKGTKIFKMISKGFGPNNKSTIASKDDKGGNLQQSRSEAKQVVRERIKSMLLSAGWTVDYRRRHGKEYDDAVYINPEGHSHWSVTLAYNKLKEQYEDGDNDSITCKTGFTFIPIPEEELSMLTRVATKRRISKEKLSEAGNGVIVADRVDKQRRHNEELGYVNSSDKSLKGRTKRKPLLSELDDSTGRLDKGTSLASRKFKRQLHKRKRCALLARDSNGGAESESGGYIPYNGKRTVLSWLIDSGIVPLKGKVMHNNQIMETKIYDGWITTEGIHCNCCSKILTMTEFEAHAGSKPNIYLESGTSLLQCQLDLWNKQEESERKGFHFIDVEGEDPNDDTCGICGDGGDLICCDGCPSTFHQSCLIIDNFPSGEWYCVYCSCKFCGMAGGNTCQSDNGIDKSNSALRTCLLCEEKYHQSCTTAVNASDNDPCNQSFCSKNCEELFERLEMLLGVKQDLEEGFSWTLIHRSDVSSDLSLTGMREKIECNSKLAVALSIMDECFLPLIDHKSGENLIRNILYNFGSNFKRLDYRGFVTAVLEKDDELIAAASIRIHGNQLAEMPFIGTRYMYRRQGMCRRLLNAIESTLCSLNVDRLVIPAISELRQTWSSIFGFKPLETSSKQKMRSLNLLVFPGVAMLEKPLISHLDNETFRSQGLVSADCGNGKGTVVGLANYSDKRCMTRSIFHFSNGDAAPQSLEENVRHALGSGVMLPDVSWNYSSDITSKPATLLDLANKNTCITQLDGTCDNSLDCVSDVHQLDQVASDNQNRIFCSISQAQNVELGSSQLKQPNMSEVECQSVVVSYVKPVATSCDEQSIHMLREATENAACERKSDGFDRSSLNYCYKGSAEHLVQSITKPCEVAPLCQSQVSVENVVCHESRNSLDQTSHEVNDSKHPKQLVGNGSVHDSDEKVPNVSDFEGGSDIAAHDIQTRSACNI